MLLSVFGGAFLPSCLREVLQQRQDSSASVRRMRGRLGEAPEERGRDFFLPSAAECPDCPLDCIPDFVSGKLLPFRLENGGVLFSP